MAAPYDLVSDALNTARTRLNDEIATLQPVSGKLLENNQYFTQQLVNTAWRKLQAQLANLGFTLLRQEAIVTGLPVVADTDPASQVRIDWSGFFDGTTTTSTPVLPADLIIPLRLWERQTGTNSSFRPMENIMDGLPTWAKRSWNSVWEWRADAIYMPGALMAVDLRIRYNRYLSDFLDTVSPLQIQWFEQQIPMTRALDALSYYICAEIADGRDDLDGDRFRTKGEAAAKLIMNRDVAMKQRVNLRRQSRSGRLEGYGTYGPY